MNVKIMNNVHHDFRKQIYSFCRLKLLVEKFELCPIRFKSNPAPQRKVGIGQYYLRSIAYVPSAERKVILFIYPTMYDFQKGSIAIFTLKS